ncbi:hypothetical protein E2320_002810 [Naja naja]|nr:hypothetical protein E2320_002810 [Naja naja]
MSWTCCKDELSEPQRPKVEDRRPTPKANRLDVPVAYIFHHEEDDDQEQPGSSGQDDGIEYPLSSTNNDFGAKEIGTQTNPRYFSRSPMKVTLDEIQVGLQNIQITLDCTMKDLEQRISRLERIVLKMRNAWVHHKTCHFKGLEYDDKQEK